MAHKFDQKLPLDPGTGLPLARGPVQAGEPMSRITVWLYQNGTAAAARGSKDWTTPATGTWDCPITFFPASNPFSTGDALGMAVAVIIKDGTTQYYGWWDKVKII
jgi:hypothetical protein